jgi:hypothetical protein
MAIIVPQNLRFTGSISPDVEGYKLYYEEVPNLIDEFTSPVIDLGIPPIVDSKYEVNLSLVLPPDTDGVFNLGLSAYDDIGNESIPSLKSNVPLDFVAPSAPTDLEIVIG